MSRKGALELNKTTEKLLGVFYHLIHTHVKTMQLILTLVWSFLSPDLYPCENDAADYDSIVTLLIGGEN